MTFQASESRNGGTNVKGGLTTLLMRGSITMKNLSLLVLRITSVMILQEEKATTSPNQRAAHTNRNNSDLGFQSRP